MMPGEVSSCFLDAVVNTVPSLGEHAVVLGAGPSIEPGDLVDAPESAAPEQGFALRQTVDAAADGAERELIERALEAAGRSRTRAAQLLGIGRRTLLYKIKRYGLR